MPLAVNKKVAAMLSVKAKPADHAIEIRFRDEQNLLNAIDVPDGALGAFVSALMEASRAVPSSGTGQVMNATAARVFVFPDGRLGLEITLEGSLRLPIAFPKNAIPALRKMVDALESLKKANDAESRH